MKKRNKLGAMMPKTIITLILLLLGFAIILIVYSTLNAKSQIDKEVCHDSVIFRSTFNAGFIETGKDTIPLKCKTEKICLSMSGDDCLGMTPTKKNSVTEVELGKDDEDARTKILETIANAMYDCNSMLGEGRLDFMPHGFTEKNYCLICSRFALDTEAREEVKEIGYGELYKYLGKKKTPSGDSYLNYLHPGWVNWEESKELFSQLQINSTDEDFKKLDFEDWKIDLEFEKGYAIIAIMSPTGTWEEITASIGVAMVGIVGGALLVTGVGAPLGVGLLATAAGAVGGGAVFWYSFPENEYSYSPPSIKTYEAETLKSLGCSSFETSS